MALKVFLDTNIIIRGKKDPEHVELKSKANEGYIHLFASDDVFAEQTNHSLKLFEFNYHLDPIYRKNHNQNISKILHENRKLLQKKEVSEKNEREFWDDCIIDNPICTFSRLISSAFLPKVRLALDTKGEMNLLNELIVDFNIKSKDAILLMTANSATIEYFLTWDDKLKKRASKVEWLYPKVTTPSDFLQEI